MKKKILCCCLALTGALWGGCGGDSTTNDPAGTGGGADDAAGPGDGSGEESEAAVGPYECLEGNVARMKDGGYTEKCGLRRCKEDVGCAGALGCKSDDDCVSNTLEAGWTVDYPVTCDESHACEPKGYQ